MTYRVMKIGNKFAAQIIDDQGGIPQSYISCMMARVTGCWQNQ